MAIALSVIGGICLGFLAGAIAFYGSATVTAECPICGDPTELGTRTKLRDQGGRARHDALCPDCSRNQFDPSPELTGEINRKIRMRVLS
jgi:hypothetical protein